MQQILWFIPAIAVVSVASGEYVRSILAFAV
jgi:hypothetical protein